MAYRQAIEAVTDKPVEKCVHFMAMGAIFDCELEADNKWVALSMRRKDIAADPVL